MRYSDDELGSFANPVKAAGPFGQREFLRRLVCPGGMPPTFTRAGSVGAGADGHMLDRYEVACAADGIRTSVFMDMYHAGYRERSHLRPFQVLAELPARSAPGCPPRVHADPDSSANYVFDFLEVESPARAINEPEPHVDLRSDIPISFVVDAKGIPDPESMSVPARLPDSVRTAIRTVVSQLRYSPALHHGSCAVRQRVGLTLRSERE